MKYQREYKGTIWTNHALQRLRERNIKQGDAWAVWSKPDSSKYSQSQGGWVYTRTWGTESIEVVAKQNDKKEWVILSVWSKTIPVKSSSKSSKSQQKSRKPSFWRKLFYLLTNPDRQ